MKREDQEKSKTRILVIYFYIRKKRCLVRIKTHFFVSYFFSFFVSDQKIKELKVEAILKTYDKKKAFIRILFES